MPARDTVRGPVRGPVRIANCSGFYGDRLSAMREMLTGGAAGPVDYLTGDYLAELTMLILGRDRMKNPERGYAKTFLTQLEDCLGEARDRGIRIVAWESTPGSPMSRATTCWGAPRNWDWAPR